MTLLATQPHMIFVGASAKAAAADTYRQLNLFGDVFERVRADYVEKPDDSKLIETAINGMLAGLDPHSSYMDPKSFRDMQVQTRGEFGGLSSEAARSSRCWRASDSSLMMRTDVTASPTSCVTSTSSWSLLALSSLVFERSWLLMDANCILAPASPKTPAKTSKVATMSNQNLQTSGWSGARIMPRLQSSRSSRYSETITTISPTMPIPTANAHDHASVSHQLEDASKVFVELSSAEMQLFRADMEASKAEASMGSVEGVVAKVCIITSMALFFFGGVALVVATISTKRRHF